MQPKFTLRKSGLFGRFFATAVILALFAQVTFAQQGRLNQGSKPKTQASAERIQNKLRSVGARATGSNDAGISTAKVEASRTEAICTTYTGSLDPGDPTLSTGRFFRDGVPSTCAAPKTCPGPFGGAGNQYDTYSWTNGLGVPQCITVNFTNTSPNTFAHFVSAHLGSFDPSNICANYIADQGGSAAAGGSAAFSFTIPGSATVVFAVTSVNAGTGGSYTMTVDGDCTIPPPCSGTPAPGNTISSVPTVCPSIPFNLSVQNPTLGSGVTYQWQRSPDGTTWTNFGSNAPTQSTTQTAATYYRAQVTCGANTGISTPVQVLLTPASGCYCIPPNTDCTDNDVITRVRISTLDNPSACSAGGYGNYTLTVPAPDIYRGANNAIIVDVPTVWPETVTAWIDYNQNGQFEASEYTVVGNNNSGGTINGTIVIPGTANLGITRMRVRVQFAATTPPTGACSGFTFGETEDYNVNIVPCVPITITGQPSNTTTQCSGNASFTVVTNGSLPSYSWQYRLNSASPWQTVTAGGVYGSNVNGSTLNLTGVPSTMNGYQYRALVTGGCSAVDFSSAATLTVGPLVATVSPTSATICSGQNTSITLTNISAPIQVISEGFNTVSPLPAGWFSQNNSTPAGSTSWFQGNTGVFPAQSGPPDSYIGANFNNTTGNNTISNWLLTPQVTIKNGDVFKFWTRTFTTADFPDRLEVRMSTSGASTNVGATNASVGDFTNLLLTINPSLLTGVYPDTWTEYTITVSGLPGVTSGRMAFRYFVTGGGPSGANSDYIGIDNVTYTAGATTAGIWTANPAAPNTMFTDPGLLVPYTGTPVQTIYVNPTVTTVYSVVYSTTIPACTSNPTNVTVTVVNPVSAVVHPTNKSVCVGGSTTFTASATGGPFTWAWDVSTDGGATWNPVPGATTGTLSVNNVTQVMNNNRYRARISAPPCAGTTTTNEAVLTVNPLPTVTATATSLAITPGQTSTLSVTSSPAPGAPANYQWYYNGNPVGAAINTHTVGIDELGSYQAEVTDVNGCRNISNTVVIGAQQSDKLWIYPNPTDGQFLVRLYYDGPYTDIRWIHIYNEKGQLVHKKAFDLYPTQPPYMQMNFDLRHLSSGTYVVKVEEKYTGKIKSGLVVIQ